MNKPSQQRHFRTTRIVGFSLVSELLDIVLHNSWLNHRPAAYGNCNVYCIQCLSQLFCHFSLRQQRTIITSATLVMTYTACVGEHLSSPVLHTQRGSLLLLLRMECNNLCTLMRHRSELGRNLVFRFAGHENNINCLQEKKKAMLQWWKQNLPVSEAYKLTSVLFSNVWVLISFYCYYVVPSTCNCNIFLSLQKQSSAAKQIQNVSVTLSSQLCPIPKKMILVLYFLTPRMWNVLPLECSCGWCWNSMFHL